MQTRTIMDKSNMKIPIYQIDAFAEERFRGNPAAVCVLQDWLPDQIMQNIAAENNLAETAFVVEKNGNYELRWFTPAVEVDLCGHATLATAYAFKEHLGYKQDEIIFRTKSGLLKAEYGGNVVSLVFPKREAQPCAAPESLLSALDVKPIEVMKSRDYLVVLKSEDEVRGVTPDFRKLKEVDSLGVIVTAQGKEADFVSRFFAPQAGIDEDPVTGSAHTTLIPYWSRRLRKKNMTALQLSKRGGKLYCDDIGDTVKISGKAVSYLTGEITV